MYCQKCNRLLKDDNTVCPKCGFDNDESNKKQTLKDIKSKIKPKKTPSKTSLVIIFLSLVVIGLTATLIIYEQKHNKSEDEDIVEITDISEYTNTFTYKELSLNYPDTWGSSTGTIFYKEYAKVNINFRTIDLDEYNELLDINECLDYLINDIQTKTYATDTSYSYIFELDNTYYLITINYPDNNSIFTSKLRKEVNNILSTLKQK